MAFTPSGRLREASPVRTLQLGDHKLTYLPDGAVQLHPTRWLPDSTAADWQSRADHLDGEGFLVASIGALLVEYQDRALLIDTGYGPRGIPAEHTHPALGALQGGGLRASLDAHGRPPASVDTIAFTHLHDDHLGWAFARAEAAEGLLFEHAAFVTSGAEWSSWPPMGAGIRDTALGARIRAVDNHEEIFPGVTAWLTPGHSAGHTSYVISSGSERVIAFGDVMHSPAQVGRPDWRVSLDADPALAVHTRGQVLQALSQPGTIGFGGHFADVVFGSVVAGGSGYEWKPLH